MKSKQNFRFYMLRSVTVFALLSRALAAVDHDTSKHTRRAAQNDIENNYISDVPEATGPAGGPNAFSYQYDAPSAFAKSDRHFSAGHHHHQHQQLAQHQQHPHAFRHAATPTPTSRRQFNEKESFKSEKYTGPHEQKEYSDYILTARGKENIYEDEAANRHKPQHFVLSYPPKHGESKTPVMKMNFEKSFKKRGYAYSSHRSNEGSLLPPPLPAKDDHEQSSPESDFVKPRTFGGPSHDGHQRLAYSAHPPHHSKYHFEKTDTYGSKTSPWKQLGPNVEISSSSAESPIYSKQTDAIAPDRKKTKQKRKNAPKNMRAGYMTQQHALYVANNLHNLQNAKPSQLKGVFDHGHVLKQSDKFEITDAMITEAEKEQALQNIAPQRGPQKARIKQESPKDQLYHYEPADVQSFQYYGQAAPHLLNVPSYDANALHAKYYAPFPQLSAFGKGFVRNIEIETTPSGAKRSIPALIIPLTAEQLNSPYFNGEVSAPSGPGPAPQQQPYYVNNADILNPRPKPATVHSFPYDIVSPARLPQDGIANAVVPAENYPVQQAPPAYQYKTGPSADGGYNTYVTHHSQNQNQNAYQRVPFNYNPSTTPAVVADESSKTAPIAYSTQSFTIHTAEERTPRYGAPNSATVQGRHTNAEGGESERRAAEYAYEQPENDGEKYLSPAETSYYTTIASVSDGDGDGDGDDTPQQSYEKSDARRN